MRVSTLAIALWLTACGSSLSPAEHIERTRVIAARVHAEGDPTRASLVAGERGTIEYLVASPGASSDLLGASFGACLYASAAGYNGVLGCSGAIFDGWQGDVSAAFAPAFEVAFDVPVSPDSSTLLAYLATCVDGPATLDASVPSVVCAGDGRSDLHRSLVPIVTDAALANHNPNLRDQHYFLDDVLWTEPQAAAGANGCAAFGGTSSLPLVRQSRVEPPLSIFGITPDDRESYRAYDADSRPIVAREAIDVTQFATHGTAADPVRFDDASGLVASMPWIPPSDAELTSAQRGALATGLLVRLWFVARDRRGGSDWAERDLCLVP